MKKAKDFFRNINYEKALIVVLIIAFANYVTGYYWGLTSVFGPDEGKLVEAMRAMVESKTLFHGVWAYPAMSSSKVLAFVLIQIQKLYELAPIQYYYANRISNAVLATGSVYMTWLILKRIKNERFAFTMAFIMAICPLWSRYAKQVTGDIPALFFSLCVLYAAQSYIRTNLKKYLILMSFFAACATLEKWHGGWTCLLIAIVVLLSHFRDSKAFFQDGIIAVAAFFLSIIMIAPNLLIDLEGLITGIKFTYVYDGTVENPLFFTYPGYFFSHIGILSLIALLVGIYNVFFSIREDYSLEYYMVFLFSPICLFAFWFIMVRTTFERWGCGVYWGMLLLVLEGIFVFVNSPKRNIRFVGFTTLILVIACFVSESLMVDLIATNTHKDARIIGEDVLAELGANEENTLSDYYTTFAPGGMRSAGESIPISSLECGDGFAIEQDGVPYIKVPDVKYVVIGGFDWSRKKGGGYAVVKKCGKKLTGLKSANEDFDLFAMDGGTGNWHMTEIDIIRKNMNNIKDIIHADVIGPSFDVYDISGFRYN